MTPTFQAAIGRLQRRRRLAGLIAELGYHMAPAARDPACLTPRDCPVCDGAPEPEPALIGPVYAFHRCVGCGLLFAPKVLSRRTTRRLYGERPVYREYWDLARADALSLRERGVHAPFARRLAELAPSRGRALDVGCGFGVLVAELAEHFDEAIGVELNKKTAREGEKLFDVQIRTERLERLNLPAGSVHLVVMNQVLEHLTHVKTTIQAAHRLLAPGGVLFVSIPHGQSIGMRMLGGRHPFVSTHSHVNMFDRDSLRRMGERAGFRVRSLATTGRADLHLAEALIGNRLARRSTVAASAMAFDAGLRTMAGFGEWPARLGLGSHLEAVFQK